MLVQHKLSSDSIKHSCNKYQNTPVQAKWDWDGIWETIQDVLGDEIQATLQYEFFHSVSASFFFYQFQ